jgi:succinate dehydrogenase / fumarate reductase iron-sulfur subunit
VPELLSSLPAILKALQRGKVTPKKALLHQHKAPKEVKRIFEAIHEKDERYELNLYVVGEEEDEGTDAAGDAPADAGGETTSAAAGGQLPEERSPNK